MKGCGLTSALFALAAGAAAWTMGAAVAPGRARAAGAGASVDDLSLVVVLILGVALLYLAAHLVVGRLQKRFLVLTGVEYLLLGVLLGPVVPQIPALNALTSLMPMVALAAGWIGLLRGMELDFRRLGQAPSGAGRIAVLHGIFGGGIVALGGALFWRAGFLRGLDAEVTTTAATLGFLACAAAAGATGPVDLLESRYKTIGNNGALLRRASRLSDLFAVFVFGMLFCVYHHDGSKSGLELRPTEWAVVSVLLGALLGFLFRPFLGGDENENNRFLALVGVITFASGAAYILELSPLFVNLTLGVTLVNTAQSGARIRTTLENTEKPMDLVLMVLAGALWTPPPVVITLYAIAAFIAFRFAGKLVAGGLSSIGNAGLTRIYLGLLGHGEVTVAMAVSFKLVYSGPLVDVAYTTVLASLVAHNLVAPRILRTFLVDVGEIKSDPRSTSMTIPAAR